MSWPVVIAAVLVALGCRKSGGASGDDPAAAEASGDEAGGAAPTPAPETVTPPPPTPPVGPQSLMQSEAPPPAAPETPDDTAPRIGFGNFVWLGTTAWRFPPSHDGALVDFKGFRYVSTPTGVFVADLAAPELRFARLPLVDFGAETNEVDALTATSDVLMMTTRPCAACTKRFAIAIFAPGAGLVAQEVPREATLLGVAGTRSFWQLTTLNTSDVVLRGASVSNDWGKTLVSVAAPTSRWTSFEVAAGKLFGVGNPAPATSVGLYGLDAAGTTMTRLRNGGVTRLTAHAAGLLGATGGRVGTDGLPHVVELGVSTDGGVTFTPAATLDLPGYKLAALVAEPATNVVHALMAPTSATGGSRLFRSADGGVTFADAAPSGLPHGAERLVLASDGLVAWGGTTAETRDLKQFAIADGNASFAPLAGQGPALPPRIDQVVPGFSHWYWPRDTGLFRTSAGFAIHTRLLEGAAHRVEASTTRVVVQTETGLHVSSDGTTFRSVSDDAFWKTGANRRTWALAGSAILVSRADDLYLSVDDGATFEPFPAVLPTVALRRGASLERAVAVAGSRVFLCVRGRLFATALDWTSPREIELPAPCAGIRADDGTLVAWSVASGADPARLMLVNEGATNVVAHDLTTIGAAVADAAVTGNRFLVATARGFAYSVDGGATWRLEAERDGLASTALSWLRIAGGTVVLGSPRGLVTRSLPVP